MPAELHDFLHPYLNRLDEELEGRSPGPNEEDEFDRLESWLDERGRAEPAADVYQKPARNRT